MSAGKHQILYISPEAAILGAIAFLTVPLPWLTSAFIAALVHEASHLAAVKLCGGTMLEFSITPRGALIRTTPLPMGASIFCAAAGPIGSLLLLLAGKWLPLVAVCGLIQGTYNLLPVYPLDGGKILSDVLNLLGKTHADRISALTEILVVPILLAAACFLTIIFHFGIIPILAAVILLLRILLHKNSLQTAPRESTIVLPNNKR